MTTTAADELLAQARQLHAAGDVAAGHKTAQEALNLDPEHAATLEFLAMSLVARQRRFAEGLILIDRAVASRPADAGVWYARGWCYEFAAHEIRRGRNSGHGLEPMILYATAADSFRRCLSLQPDGKLLDDAQDLLEYVENELSR